MQKLLLLMLTSFLTFNAIAECPSNVQKIKTGTSSPCDGWIVSEPQMQKFAKADDELELTKKLVQAQEHLQKLSNAEIEYYKKRSNATEKALSQSERQKLWVGIAGFAVGVILTGVAAKAAIEATK